MWGRRKEEIGVGGRGSRELERFSCCWSAEHRERSVLGPTLSVR